MAKSLWTIPFGKYKDTDVEDVPDTYLIWLKGEGWFKNKYKEQTKIVEAELKYRDKFELHVVEERHGH